LQIFLLKLVQKYKTEYIWAWQWDGEWSSLCL